VNSGCCAGRGENGSKKRIIRGLLPLSVIRGKEGESEPGWTEDHVLEEKKKPEGKGAWFPTKGMAKNATRAFRS